MKKLSTLATLVLALLLSIKSFAVPQLNSLPNAAAVIFLDFDGHYVYSSVWNGGAPINCASSGMTDIQITEAFNRTAEDFRPFDINITTDSTVFLAASFDKRMRIIITPTSAWFPGVGGVSYIGSFIWGDDSPAFVFCDRLGPNNPKMVGECCSHESGHTIGLSHQSRYGSNCSTPTEQYNSGTGSGEASWAPIMGNSYYKNMSNWNDGPTPYGCTNVQDNLSIITTQNGFGYRADDYSELLDASTTTLAAGNFSAEGIISTNTDEDAFKFIVSQNSNFYLTAIPFNVGLNYMGANLDIKLDLFNSSGTLINSYDPVDSMSVVIDTVLNAGTYYIKIDGSGNTNVGEYGSLGSYTLNGSSALLPIHDVALKGNTENGKHNLSWYIIADEPVQSILIQSSADGINFTRLSTVISGATNYSYNQFKNSSVYYRLKIISVTGKIVYSNTVVLKGVANLDNNFKVSTFIQNEILVKASVAFQYLVSDINGRALVKGKGESGFNTISISNQSKGMYIIQFFSNNKLQTERIIKQ
jgi:hypothetical protein